MIINSNDTLKARLNSVWEKYNIAMKTHAIRRMGVKYHGICALPIYLADQNVMEHTCLVAIMAACLRSMFPELNGYFPPYYLETLLVHDLAETVIGDIADDGSADAALHKDEQEYMFIGDFVSDFDDESKNCIMLNFSHLQKKDNILYLIDKLEWILFVAYLTPSGEAGSLKYKESHIGLTNQDRHAIEVTGSYRTVDVMVVHFMEHSRG